MKYSILVLACMLFPLQASAVEPITHFSYKMTVIPASRSITKYFFNTDLNKDINIYLPKKISNAGWVCIREKEDNDGAAIHCDNGDSRVGISMRWCNENRLGEDQTVILQASDMTLLFEISCSVKGADF
jgi:hypothetical protein